MPESEEGTSPNGGMLVGEGIGRVLNSYIVPDLVGFLVSQVEITALLSRRSKAPSGFYEMDGGYAWRFNFEGQKLAQQLGPNTLANYLLRHLTLDAGRLVTESNQGQQMVLPAHKKLPQGQLTPLLREGKLLLGQEALLQQRKELPASRETLSPSLETPSQPQNGMFQPPEVPLFVLLGRHGNSDMLLNLRHVQHLSVQGSPEQVDNTMSSLAMDLLSDPFRRDVQICLVGFGGDFEMFPQVSVFDKLSELAVLLFPKNQGTSNSKLRNRLEMAWPTSLQQSMSPLVGRPPSAPADPSTPADIVIFAPTAESSQMLAELERLNVFLITSFSEASWMLELGPKANRLHPLDIQLVQRSFKIPSEVPASTLLTMLSLHGAKEPHLKLQVDQAMQPKYRGKPRFLSKPAMLPKLKLSRSARQGPRRIETDNEAHQDTHQPRKVRVCVLGPVEVHGINKKASQQCLDFICYLAFHREGVTSAMALESLWKGKTPPHIRTVTALASRARSALGKGSQNQPLLPRVGADKAYRLSTEVTTDYDEFCLHLRRARNESAASLVHLRRALQLVRGAPFNGPSFLRYSWADLSLRVHMECLIDEAAHRLADLALKFNDPATARWACYQAHKIVPGCEQCYIRRFKIAQKMRDRAELQSAMAELYQIVSVEEGCAISPFIYDAYLSLLENGNWQ